MAKAKKKKRKVEILVLSDIHLGTYGCQAKELLRYLKTIKPQEVILNGDIIDVWQFRKKYWPKDHMLIIKHIISWVSKGVKVTYITGNHDEMLRKFTGFSIGSFSIQNKLKQELRDGTAWIFHGDVFDVTMQHSKWLAKLGAVGYDLLIFLNACANAVSMKLGKGKLSFSKKIKNSVKSAVKFINEFEQTAVDIASEKGYKYVICGHIHQPEMKTFITKGNEVIYLNSGDWIENLTALEYNYGEWSIYSYFADPVAQKIDIQHETASERTTKELFGNLMNEFELSPTTF